MPTPSERLGLAPDDLALARSAMWEALALGFRPPTGETIARLASREFW